VKNIFFISLLFLFNTCNINKQSADQKCIISLERTACFGNCPIYKIELFNNGKGIYNGKKFIDKIGVVNFKISIKNIQKILKMADSINFNNLKKEYYEPISDLPTSYIKIKNKKIKNYSGAPKELHNLENLIDSICLKKVFN
jgi:hypothetical protein